MLYREDMWLSFKRDKKRYPNYPEFYFYFTPTAMSYGCGFYTPTAGTMAALREMILKHDAPFEKARQSVRRGSRSAATYTSARVIRPARGAARMARP